MKIQATPILSLFVSTLALVACSGGDDGGGNGGAGSGQDSAALVTTLDASGTRALCAWSIDEQGGAGSETDCGDGITVSIGTVDECIADIEAFGSCDMTVAQYEACSEALAEAACTFGGSACEPLFACL